MWAHRCLLPESTQGFSGCRGSVGAELELIIHGPVPGPPWHHGETTGPAPPPPLAHPWFSKQAGKIRTCLILDYQEEKQPILTPLLGLAPSDCLGQSQPFWRQKHTPLTAAFEPNPQLVWHNFQWSCANLQQFCVWPSSGEQLNVKRMRIIGG